MASATDVPSHWAAFEAAMREADGEAADRALAHAVQFEPDQGTAFFRISKIAYRTGQVSVAIGSALRASRSPPGDPATCVELATQLMVLGESAEARALCAALPEDAPAALHLEATRILIALEDFPAAESALRRAAPGLPPARLYRFRARLDAVAGRLDEAELGFVRALRDGTDAELDAAYLSRLHTWSRTRNHVGLLRDLWSSRPPGAPQRVGYAFGLAKQLHDLGDYPGAWAMLEQGCAAKRASLRYDPAADSALMARVAGSRPPPPAPGQPEGPVPIFILGLPRAGSTVLERMVGNHSQVESVGEPMTFIVQLRRMCGLPGLDPLDAALLDRMAGIDPGELGRAYLAHLEWRLHGKPFFIDKTPLNYLHIGMIRAALPQARILHAFRDPVDACFSMLKFAFPWLYPFSYDQHELAAYYLRYREVMAHWHGLHPDAILDVGHDALLDDPEMALRDILRHCGLPWEPGLTDLSRNRAPAATGSNAQVRDGITTRYRGQWRPYAKRLEPLYRALEAGGVLVESPAT